VYEFENCKFTVMSEGKRGQRYKNVVIRNCVVSNLQGNGYVNHSKTFRECIGLKIDGISLDRIICSSNSLFRDCHFSNLKGSIVLTIGGCAFSKCVLSGNISNVKFTLPYDPDDKTRSQSIRWLEVMYSKTSWALDISNATFVAPNWRDSIGDTTFEGIPGEKIVRSPKNSILMSNFLAAEVDSEKLGLKNVAIKHLVHRAKFSTRPDAMDVTPCVHWEFQVLVNCGRNSKEMKQYDRDFDRLCKLGLAKRE
jgi:hypothetical protein